MCLFNNRFKRCISPFPILEEESKFKAFEADGKLYKFTRLPFGVTKGTAEFGRAMRRITEGLNGVKIFLDDIFVVGINQEEHDSQLRSFLQRAREYKLSLNSKKCTFEQPSLTFLGHKFEDGNGKPDPDRLDPVMTFPVPTNKKRTRTIPWIVSLLLKMDQRFFKDHIPFF